MTTARIFAALFCAAALTFSPAASVAASTVDPNGDDNLEQTIPADAPTGSGQVALSRGHVDIGPRFIDDRWEVQVHDDTEDLSVWRDPADVVLQVGDSSVLTVPDDPAYEFLGIDPGSTAYVVPQTQNPDVVWVGWNTQDPRVMDTIDRGVTLDLLSVEGPGTLSVYLQSGTLGDPEPLWSSAATQSQPLFVEVNTHTHANWVFSEPGVYLVEVAMTADLASGETVTAQDALRFSVGDTTPVADAFAASYSPSYVAAGEASDAGDAERTSDASSADSPMPLYFAIGGVALLLATGVVVASVRGSRARSRARAGRNNPPREQVDA